ncbi:MAG: hypothetical protein WEA61_07425 [Anaerolineales bacterium]
MKVQRLLLLLSFLVAATAAAWSPQPADRVAALACEDEPKVREMPRFARLMHDPQWMEWPSRMGDSAWPGGFYLDWYPETVQLTTGPHSGDGRLTYSRPWLEYLRDLQPNDEAAVWITRIAAGLFDRVNEEIPILDLDRLETKPVAEAISSGGNVVKILETKNGAGRIEMIFYRKYPPDPSVLNYQTKPWLVTKFTSVSREGELGNAGGIDVYFPNLAKNKKGYWVELKRIEWFPLLPFCGIAEGSLNIHSAPGGAITGSLGSGQPFTVEEYLPQGSNVWGRIDGGWILLEYQSDGLPIYPTTWEMETRPPIDY